MDDIRLSFYNTLTRKLEPFESFEEGHARFYTCGPTVYNFSHIGNLRTFLFEDILRRTLKLFGWRVTQVMNLTDIDDKTIRSANEAGVSLREFTDTFIQAFFEDLDTLRIERAEHYPRATDFITEMAHLVKTLEEGGHTYRSGDSIYYRISTFPSYGKLSRIRLDKTKAGARVDSDEYEKDDARDFVLWKGAKEGEPSWDTEIGSGRPGWHLECSAMAMSLLGETFDIHTGGVDNIFPHHENEIAQSEGASGQPFARFWLHAEHLNVESEKMAKSKGNFFTLRELIERGYDPIVIRYLLMSVPYRQKLNFTFDGLHAAEQALERISNTLRRLEHTPEVEDEGALHHSDIENFRRQLREGLADDLNTAKALAALHTVLHKVNTALDGGGISSEVRSALFEAFTQADSVLGIFPVSEATELNDDDEIQSLVDQRTDARKNKDFARSDAIRDELTARGILVEDTPHGPVWRRG